MWGSRRRHDLLELLDRLNPTIAELTQAIEAEVATYPAAQRLMTHPGVGALTALAFVLIIGEAERFQCGKQIAAYLGLVPEENSSGEAGGSDISANRGVGSCVSCWWKRPRSQYGAMGSGAADISTWRCGEGARSRTWRWRVGSRFVFTGCGASSGIMSSGKSSVRTRASPE